MKDEQNFNAIEELVNLKNNWIVKGEGVLYGA